MNTQEFEIVPPGKIATLFPLLVGLVLPLVILIAMAFAAHGFPDWLRVAPALLLMPAVAGLLALSMHGRRIRLSDNGLTLRRLPWPRPIALSTLDLGQARIVNLDEHPELRPVFKIAGSRLPGFCSGLFRLRDRRRATVLLTDVRRTLVLPLRDGSVVLLSPQRPDALLQALQAHSG